LGDFAAGRRTILGLWGGFRKDIFWFLGKSHPESLAAVSFAAVRQSWWADLRSRKRAPAISRESPWHENEVQDAEQRPRGLIFVVSPGLEFLAATAGATVSAAAATGIAATAASATATTISAAATTATAIAAASPTTAAATVSTAAAATTGGTRTSAAATTTTAALGLAAIFRLIDAQFPALQFLAVQLADGIGAHFPVREGGEGKPTMPPRLGICGVIKVHNRFVGGE